MAKERASLHRGKSGSAIHNEHFHMDKSDRNVKHFVIGGMKHGQTLRDCELAFYENHYAKMLSQQNQKYVERRQVSRVKTMEQIYECKRYRPTEEILQYGNINTEDSKLPTRRQFEAMLREYFSDITNWSNQHGNHIHLVSASLHFDEASLHSHNRFVGDYIDSDGIIKIGMERALEQAGVPLPKPGEKPGRYNNRSMVFTDMCRKKWQDILIAHGFEVETKPLDYPKGFKSKNIKQYVASKTMEMQQREDNIKAYESDLQQREAVLEAQEASLKQKQEELSHLQEKLENEANKRLNAIKQREEELQQEYDQQTKYLLAERKMASEARLKAQNGELRVEDAELAITAKNLPYTENKSVYDWLKEKTEARRKGFVANVKPAEVKQEQSLIRQRLDADRKAMTVPKTVVTRRRDDGSQLSM